jgi:hypothetical protein
VGGEEKRVKVYQEQRVMVVVLIPEGPMAQGQ